LNREKIILSSARCDRFPHLHRFARVFFFSAAFLFCEKEKPQKTSQKQKKQPAGRFFGVFDL